MQNSYLFFGFEILFYSVALFVAAQMVVFWQRSGFWQFLGH